MTRWEGIIISMAGSLGCLGALRTAGPVYKQPWFFPHEECDRHSPGGSSVPPVIFPGTLRTLCHLSRQDKGGEEKHLWGKGGGHEGGLQLGLRDQSSCPF